MGKKFSINNWINNLECDGRKIRILGTHEEPLFYYDEIISALEIVQSDIFSEKLTNKDILSGQEKRAMGVRPTKLINGREIEDNSLPLIRISGLYKMIFISNTTKAKQFVNGITGNI